MLDPRFQELDDHLAAAMCAAVAGDEHAVQENLFHLREKAWSINADIFARRWANRPRPAQEARLVRTKSTLEDLEV